MLARRADDLRNHVAGPLDDDDVALADLLAVDVLLVVERRAGDGDAADLDGLEDGPGIESAGATDPDVDLQQLRLRGHRRPLERTRPARPAVEHAEPPLLIERVDLDHDPVDLVVELDAARLPRAAGFGDSSTDSSRSANGFVGNPRSRSHSSISDWPAKLDALRVPRPVDPDRRAADRP